MVKLQKRFAYKYKDKNHYKHIITIPDDIVEKLGWKEGMEIESKIKNDELIFTLSNKKQKGFEL
ncbi:MAG: AbrB/MazE/SpoVT family DNA-binding domain-containing protein [Candidatus Nitrosocosmicus sp.]|nr:AbrB/MazE/SpoVT family DNA-binding domain-containing protein [Candidatus Nitrosocosmicus sp.]MDN5867375.1 AbrB/MazE/SpoVT family DNA-binding domain-containing protein [Candidatus Nitrosocosmicus sp.]